LPNLSTALIVPERKQYKE